MFTQDLIWGVLVCLPTKSLMRFKCVSKLWYSIIRNPKFAKAQAIKGAGFRGLLITNVFYNPNTFRETPGQPHIFFHVKLNDCGRRLIYRHLTIQEPKHTRFTPFVKGLIGLYNHVMNNFTLCNIATREFLDLPPSPSPPPSADLGTHYVYNYFLGFDPVEEVYKVLNICLRYDEENNFVGTNGTHVFTLGVNMNWRNIASPPLHSEFNEIPEHIKDGADLVEICESLAINYGSYGKCDVWTMNKHCGGGELEVWTRKRKSLGRGGLTRLNYAGTLPTGEMMVAEQDLLNFPFPIHIYDHLKNKSKLIEIKGFGSRSMEMDPQKIKICYFEENVISLDCLMRNQQQY
ncbi:hypothetical protein LIER_28520 [Lithospermum erythrorhizon]|uniref:F-box domain-containing protein n=1 Tax=Lithospermum erythrorhizon TaxID=34254 RepID=A0AAV3RGD7_LITER